MNGCCYPAARRLYVTVDGDFLLCERIGSSPKIGNVFEGLNHRELIDKYLVEYINKSLPDCAKCWAIHLCSICYLDAYNEQGFDLEKKRIACKRTKIILEEELRTYFTMLEDESHLLTTLN